MGNPSFNDDFSYAIEADKNWFISDSCGVPTFESMIKELKTSPVIDNRNLSDIFSAYLYDSPELWSKTKDTYYNLGVMVYGYDDSYWKETTGPMRAVEGEVFAELFAIYAENDVGTVKFTLNIRYRDRFGEIPRIKDFSCTREEYLEAMEMAARNGKPLGDMLLVRERFNKE